MKIAIGLILAGAIASAPFIERTQAGGLQSAGVTVESAVSMKTRDGVVLVADVYRPAGEGRFPTLLERTPYDRRDSALRKLHRGRAFAHIARFHGICAAH